jgi:acetylornithine aminotransferase
MLAIEMSEPCPEMVAEAAKKGLLINVTAQSVIRLLPTLTISEDEADQLVQILGELITRG